MRIAERVNPFLGAGFFLVAPGAAKCSIESAFRQGVEKGFGLQQSAALLGAKRIWVGAACDGLFVSVNDQFCADLLGVRVSECDHLREFIAGINVQKRKRNSSWKESLLRQAQHYRGVFANRIQHHRAREFRDRLAQYVNALRFQDLEMVQPLDYCGGLHTVYSCAKCIGVDQFRYRLVHSLSLNDGKNDAEKTKTPPATISGGGLNDDWTRVRFLDRPPPDDARVHLWTTRTTRAGGKLAENGSD